MGTVTQTVKTQQDIDQLCINTIRTLSMDAVQQANSGHPGAPMALAPVAYTLWQQFLRFDPDDPNSRLYATFFCRSCGQEHHPVILVDSGDWTMAPFTTSPWEIGL